MLKGWRGVFLWRPGCEYYGGCKDWEDKVTDQRRLVGSQVVVRQGQGQRTTCRGNSSDTHGGAGNSTLVTSTKVIHPDDGTGAAKNPSVDAQQNRIKHCEPWSLHCEKEKDGCGKP